MTAISHDMAADPRQIIAELERKLDERTSERDEAVEQQTARGAGIRANGHSSTSVGPN